MKQATHREPCITEQDDQQRCAVRLPSRSELTEPILSIVKQAGASEAIRFAPKDNDDLNSDLLAGRFNRVIFASKEDLLEAIWDGDADLSGWKSRGVRIEFIAAKGQESTLTELCEDDDLIQTANHYRSWRTERLRRKMAAAAVLSLGCVAALAVLFLAGIPKS